MQFRHIWCRIVSYETLDVGYNMMVSALKLSKLPAPTEISLFRQEISLWKFLLYPLYKLFGVKIARMWSVNMLCI